MKRKIFNVLFALVLVLSFSLVMAVPATPVMADGVPTTRHVIPFSLATEASGAAAWTSTQYHSGTSSANLTAPATADYAKVKVAVNAAFSSFAAPSFYYKINAGAVATTEDIGATWPMYERSGATVTQGYLSPYLVISITDGTTPHWIISQPWAESTKVDWTLWNNTQSSNVTTAALWHNEAFTDPAIGGSVPAGWGPLSYFENTYTGYTVVGVSVGLGNFAVTGQQSACVDDITVSGTTYNLEGTSADYMSIQAAIDAAAAGDTVSVAAGRYTENVNVNKSLTLHGASSATVTVNAANAGLSVFNVTADSVDISGFTVSGTTADGHAGIYLGTGQASCNIHDNIVTGNIYGILLLDAEDTVIPGNNTFTSNTVSNNTVSGIEMQHTYGNTFTNNTANSNGRYGFALDSARNTIFTGNTANSNTRYGFFLKQGSGLGSNNNTFTNNTANSNTMSGIRMTNSSGNTTYTGNTFDSNGIAGMELGGTDGDAISFLTVNNNSFSGNEIGVAIDTGAVITSVVLRNNNIAGNADYGISNLGTGTVDAVNNWWGNASGPQPNTATYTAYGNAVHGATFNPWLLAPVVAGVTPTTYDRTLALKDAWTLVSVDKEVTIGTAWVGTTALSGTTTVIAYKYTAGTGYTQVLLPTQLTSVDAYYIKTSGGGGVGIKYSTAAPGVVTKNLAAGWNVISCAGETDAYKLLSQLRYVQIGEQEGTGITSLIGQASYNQYLATTISRTLVTDGEWLVLKSVGSITLNAFDGYWVYMNAAKLFGVIPDDGPT